MTNAQRIIDWLTEHPNSLLSEIEKGTTLPWMFAGSYLGYMTKNGTLVYTGKKGERRYRVAEESDHPPMQGNGRRELTVRVPDDLYEQLRTVVFKLRMSQNEALTEALEMWLEEAEKQ